METFRGPDIDGACLGFCHNEEGQRLCIVSFQIERIDEQLKCCKCGKKLDQPSCMKKLKAKNGSVVYMHKLGYCY